MDTTVNQPQSSQAVSVVVVTKKGEDPSSLPSLKEQRYENPFEIIHVEGGNRSQARNLGIARSRAPLVAFIDADCEARSDWLRTLVARLPQDASVAGLGGVSTYTNSLPSLEKAVDGVFSTYVGSLNSPSLISYTKAQKSFVHALSGHNCIFRRNALIEVGGFDERFDLNEDTDICARLREKRYKLLLDLEIFVHHKRRTSMENFARQFFLYGIGRMRSMLTGRRYVDKRILGLLLAAILFVLFAPIIPSLILAAFSGYLVLILCSSIIGARRIRAVGLLPKMFLLFVVEHLSYLAGLLCGIFFGPWNRSYSTDSMRLAKYQIVSNDVVEMPAEVFELDKGNPEIALS